MVLPLLLSAIGVGLQVAGAIGEADAAKRSVKAERIGAHKTQNLVKRQNQIYAAQADAASAVAQKAAKLQVSSTKEANALRDQIVADINTYRGKAVDAANQQVAASVESENARFQQMTLDSARNRRDIIRNAIFTRSSALAAAAASGSEGGSGLQGGFAQITAEKTRNLVTENQNLQIGNTIFQANKKYAEAGGLVNYYNAQIATAQSKGEADLANKDATSQAQLAVIQAQGQDTQARLQKALYANADQQAKVQTQTNIATGKAKSDAATYQGVSSVGQSLFSLGSSLFKA